MLTAHTAPLLALLALAPAAPQAASAGGPARSGDPVVTVSARTPVDALRCLDPVELVSGREVPGREEISATRYQFRYFFANDQNRDLFERRPESFEIQLGGGCGRMGPLSGEGAPDRFAVHANKIYVFASNPCRTSFLKDPEAMLDQDDPPVEAAADALARGRELLERTLAAVGGAARVDAVRSVAARYAAVAVHNGEEYPHGEARWIAFPDRMRQERSYGKWRRADVLAPAGDFIVEGSAWWPMHPSQRSANEKVLQRELLWLLRARTRPDFVAAALGPAEIEGLKVERLALATGGETTVLGLDPKSGRVLSSSWRGRLDTGRIAELQVLHGDHRAADGLELPHARRLLADGVLVEEQSFSWDEIEIDGALDEALFRPPQG